MPAASFSDLRLRVLSGAALGAVGLGALILGGLSAAAFVAAIGGLAAWEFRRMSAPAATPGDAILYGAAVAAAVVATHVSGFSSGLLLLVASGAIFVALDLTRRASMLWPAAGMLTIGLAACSFSAMRGLEAFGLATAIWIAALVVATDVGAYFAGRLLGGPKLWERVSPKKTWAGLAGGVAAAAAAGACFAPFFEGAWLTPVATLSAVAAIVAQGGDLAESALKRRFGVKDSSTLIPGHGGVLDRIDGFCAVTLAVAAMTYARGAPAFGL